MPFWAWLTGTTASKQNDDEPQDEDLGPQEELVWNSNLKINWTEKEERRLRASILRDKTDSNGEKIKMRLLVFGQTGHGKSTLCNGFRSALSDDGRVSHYFQGGKAGVESTFTKGVKSSLHGENLRIMDMSGLYETDKLKNENITKILRGEVDFGEQMSELLEVCNKCSKETDAGSNNISCLVIVLRPDKEFGPHVKRLFGEADDLVKRGVISRHAVISFLDKVDPIFKMPENIPQFLTSSKVKNAVMEVSDMTGIPPSAISVVSNYWNQSRTDLNTNILLLHALDDILYDAREHHEKIIAEKRDAEKKEAKKREAKKREAEKRVAEKRLAERRIAEKKVAEKKIADQENNHK